MRSGVGVEAFQMRLAAVGKLGFLGGEVAAGAIKEQHVAFPPIQTEKP